MQNIGKWARPTRRRVVDAVVLIIPGRALPGFVGPGKPKKTGSSESCVGGIAPFPIPACVGMTGTVRRHVGRGATLDSRLRGNDEGGLAGMTKQVCTKTNRLAGPKGAGQPVIIVVT